MSSSSTTDKTEMQFIDSPSGKIQFLTAKRDLRKAGLPDDEEEGISLIAFT